MATNKPNGDFSSLVDHYDKLDGTEYEGNQVDDTDDDDGIADDSQEPSQRSDVADRDEDQEPEGRAKRGEDDGDDDVSARRPQGAGAQDDGTDPRAGIRQLTNGAYADAKGNIVDPKTGTIIARAGSERRMWETTVRMREDLRSHQTKIQELEGQLRGAQVLNNIPTKYGLTNDETAEGLGFTVAFKEDPVGTVRKLVERVGAMGYNVSDILGKDAGDAIELNAVKRMLDERLGPLQREREQQQQYAAQRANAEKKLGEFFAEHEHAELHSNELNRLVGDTNLSPERAYYELKLFATKHGLDFSKPLRPQVARLQQQGNRRQQEDDEGEDLQPRARVAFPNGRGGGSRRSMNDTEMADPRSSWDDIINSVTRNS